jgi:hypothetical protein
MDAPTATVVAAAIVTAPGIVGAVGTIRSNKLVQKLRTEMHERFDEHESDGHGGQRRPVVPRQRARGSWWRRTTGEVTT